MGDLNSGIMNLPEQILRQIFDHLDFITLFVTLKKVCQKMKNHVNGYIDMDMGGIFLLVEKAEPSYELLCIYRRSSKEMIVRRKTISAISCDPDWERRSYFSWNETIVCCVYQRSQHVLYQYHFETDKWEAVYRNVSFCNNISPSRLNQHSHSIILPEGKHFSAWFLNVPRLSKNESRVPEIPWKGNETPCLEISPHLEILTQKYTGNIQEVKFCEAGVIIEMPEEIASLRNYTPVCTSPKQIYYVGGFWNADHVYKRMKINESMYHSKTTKLLVNRTLLQSELTSGKLDISWRSTYINNMPYRRMPLCFKLKNSLYIVGHVPCTDSCILHDPCHTIQIRSMTSDQHFDVDDCKCCDRFDLLDEKYYRNVHSIPYSLKKVINPKVTKNEDESFAVITFYNTCDYQEKVWTFTDDEGFKEHGVGVSCKNKHADIGEFASMQDGYAEFMTHLWNPCIVSNCSTAKSQVLSIQ